MTKKLTIILHDDAPIVPWIGLLDRQHYVSFTLEEFGPPQPSGTRRSAPKHHSVNGVGTKQLIMKEFRIGDELTLQQAARLMVNHQFSENSASPALATLAKEGFVARLGGNKFRVVKALPDGHVFKRHRVQA